MPFTPAHPLAVAPLWYGSRRWLDLGAMVVGSLSPDFLYYLALRPVPTSTHSMVGSVLICLPASLVVLTVFRYLVRPAWMLLLPGPFWPERKQRSVAFPAEITILCLSVLIGAWSHLTWDAMSHSDGRLTLSIPLLRSVIFGKPLFRWIQYGSGAAGTVAVLIWMWWAVPKECRKLQPSPLSSAAQLMAWTTAALSINGLALFSVLYFANEGVSVTDILARALVGGISGGIAWSVLFALLLLAKDSSLKAHKKSRHD